MTPLVAELHNAHKERLARIARAAIIHRKPIKPKPSPMVVESPMPTVKAEPKRKLWFCIEDFEELSSRKFAIGDIQKAVCAYYGLTRNDLVSARRTKKLVIPRHVAMYLCRELTPRSHPWIGRFFGHRDHTVSIYACNKIRQLIAKDEVLAADVATIMAALTEGYQR